MLVLFLFFIIVVGLFGYMIGKYVKNIYICVIKIFYELNVFSDFKLKFL